MNPLRTLLGRWASDAETLRRRGAPAQADALEANCRELEEALVAHDLESLTIPEAVKESGYSASQIRRMFRGQRNVTRGALPRKPHLKAGQEAT
jgi:hypothetical protein